MRQDIKVMQTFVDTMVGIPKFSYPARKNAPRPKGDFCSIALIEQYETGLPYEHTVGLVNELGECIGIRYYYVSAVTLRFRLGVIDSDGRPSIRIANGWTTEKIKRLMIQEGYGFLKSTPISLEDKQLELAWEERQGFSVLLSTDRVIVQDECFIDAVDVNGVYIEGDLSTEIQLQINNT